MVFHTRPNGDPMVATAMRHSCHPGVRQCGTVARSLTAGGMLEAEERTHGVMKKQLVSR